MKAQRLPKRTALHKEPQGLKPGRQAPGPALPLPPPCLAKVASATMPSFSQQVVLLEATGSEASFTTVESFLYDTSTWNKLKWANVQYTLKNKSAL